MKLSVAQGSPVPQHLVANIHDLECARVERVFECQRQYSVEVMVTAAAEVTTTAVVAAAVVVVVVVADMVVAVAAVVAAEVVATKGHGTIYVASSALLASDRS